MCMYGSFYILQYKYPNIKKKKRLKIKWPCRKQEREAAVIWKGHKGPPGGAVLACLDCHKEIQQTGQLKKQKLIFTQFWRLEVQDWGCWQVWFLPRHLCLAADGCLSPVSSHVLFSLPARVCSLCSYRISLLVRTSVIPGYGITLITSFNLNYHFKVPISKYTHIIKC